MQYRQHGKKLEGPPICPTTVRPWPVTPMALQNTGRQPPPPARDRPEEVVLPRRDPMDWTKEHRLQSENLLTVIRLTAKRRGGSVERLLHPTGQLRQAEVADVLKVSRCFQHATTEETLPDMLELLRARGHTWERRGGFLYEQ